MDISQFPAVEDQDLISTCLAVEDQLVLVVSYLEVRPSLGALLRTSRQCRALFGSEERVWRRLCMRDFCGAESERRAPCPPGRGVATAAATRFDELRDFPTWRETWLGWRALADRVGGVVLPEHFRRAVGAWRRIRVCLRAQRLGRIDASLERSVGGTDGACFADMEKLLNAPRAPEEARLVVPSSLRAVLAVHSGQVFTTPAQDGAGGAKARGRRAEDADLADDEADGEMMDGLGAQELAQRRPARRFFSGLFGGYGVYDQMCTMHLLPPRDALHLNRALATETPRWARERVAGKLLVGASLNHTRFVMLDLSDCHAGGASEGEGRVVVLNRAFDVGTLGRGGMLAYLESHAASLERGTLSAGCMIPDGPDAPISRGISLFPAGGTLCSDCVTRGVRITASALCLNREDGQNGLNFAYSVRITLLTPAAAAAVAAAAATDGCSNGHGEGDGGDDIPSQCQLQSRHWQFIDAGGGIRAVDGEAVVGKQPVLVVGGYHDLGVPGAQVSGNFVEGDFVYQSQSGPVQGTDQPRVAADATRVGRACARGTFRFVPGTLREPTGPPFDAVIGEFPFALPDFAH